LWIFQTEKIQENLKPQHFVLSREEAEEKFKDGVNSQSIYDKFGVPPQIKELSIVLFEGWNVNCCPVQHVSAGDIGAFIKILSCSKKKKELEFKFGLVKDLPQESASTTVSTTNNNNNKKTNQKSSDNNLPQKKNDANSSDDIDFVVDSILKMMSTKKDNESLKGDLTLLLTNLKNTSYSKGFMSRLEPVSYPLKF